MGKQTKGAKKRVQTVQENIVLQGGRLQQSEQVSKHLTSLYQKLGYTSNNTIIRF